MSLPTIYHIASEIAPIKKVGGMGDAVHGLTRELARIGTTLKVIFPKYSELPLKCKIEEPIELFGRKVPIHSAQHEGIDFLLIENDELFDRDLVYGYRDDTKRFGFFAIACSLLLRKLDAKIAHLHDWQAALAAPLLNKTPVQTLLSLHNIAHQGSGSKSLIEEFGLEAYRDLLEKEGRTNLLRAGILSANLLNTVSPTYAKEILAPPYSCGLEKEISTRKNDLCGILNGIDTGLWDPETDPLLDTHYSARNPFDGKMSNRKALQRYFGMGDPKGPLVSVIARFDPQKGPELMAHAIEKTRSANGQFILIGVPSSLDMEKFFAKLKTKWGSDPNVHLHNKFNERLAHLAFAASDFTVIPSIFEPCGLTQMFAMRYGTIPIVRSTGGLCDTVTDNLNGIVFEKPTKAALSKALDRAFALQHLEKEEMARRGLQCEWGWSLRTHEYIKLYKTLLKQKTI